MTQAGEHWSSRGVRRKRGPRLILASLAALVLAAGSGPVPAAAATDRLPDLRMPSPREFYFQYYNGEKRLRFTTYILNLGQGPFKIEGRRASTAESTMTVRQRLYVTDGTSRSVATGAVMRYTGDGHDHWHAQRIATYELLKQTRTGLRPVLRDGNAVVGAKVGFCFFDTNPWDLSLPGAPGYRVYHESGCGVRSSLKASMGLSVGWSDKYPANFAFQWMNVAGLGGRYRVCVTVDRFGWFRESNNENNEAWADVSFTAAGSRVSVLATGTGSCGARSPAG